MCIQWAIVDEDGILGINLTGLKHTEKGALLRFNETGRIRDVGLFKDILDLIEAHQMLDDEVRCVG